MRVLSLLLVWLAGLPNATAIPPVIISHLRLGLTIPKTVNRFEMSMEEFNRRKPFGSEQAIIVPKSEFEQLFAAAGNHRQLPRGISNARYEAKLTDDFTLSGTVVWTLDSATQDAPVLLNPCNVALTSEVTDEQRRPVALTARGGSLPVIVAMPKRDVLRLQTTWSARSQLQANNVRRFVWEFPCSLDAQMTIHHPATLIIEPGEGTDLTTIDGPNPNGRSSTLRFTGGQVVAITVRKLLSSEHSQNRPHRHLIRSTLVAGRWISVERFEWKNPTWIRNHKLDLQNNSELLALRTSEQGITWSKEGQRLTLPSFRPITWLEVEYRSYSERPPPSRMLDLGVAEEEMLAIDVPTYRELDIIDVGDFQLHEIRKDDEGRTSYEWRRSFRNVNDPVFRRPKIEIIDRSIAVKIAERGTFTVRDNRLRLEVTIVCQIARGPVHTLEYRWPNGMTPDGDDVESSWAGAIHKNHLQDRRSIIQLQTPLVTGESRTIRLSFSQPILPLGEQLRTAVQGIIWSGSVRRTGQVTVQAVVPWRLPAPLMVAYQDGPPMADVIFQRVGATSQTSKSPSPVGQASMFDISISSSIQTSLLHIAAHEWIFREHSNDGCFPPLAANQRILQLRRNQKDYERFEDLTQSSGPMERVIAIPRSQPWIAFHRGVIDSNLVFDPTQIGIRIRSSILSVNRSLMATIGIALTTLGYISSRRWSFIVMILGLMGIIVTLSVWISAVAVVVFAFRSQWVRRYIAVGLSITIAPFAMTSPLEPINVILIRDEGQGDRIAIPRSLWRILHASAEPEPIQWMNADLIGEEFEDDITWRVRWTGLAKQAGIAIIPLSDERIQSMTIDGRPAYPTRQPTGVTVEFTKAGPFTLESTIHTPVRELGLERETRWMCPITPITRLRFRSDQHASKLVAVSRLGEQRFRVTDHMIEGDLGATNTVAVRWRDSRLSMIGSESTRECSRVEISNGSVRMTSAIQFPRVRQYDPKFEITIPDGWDCVLSVGRSTTGEPIPCEVSPVSNGRAIVSFRTIIDGRPTAILSLSPRLPLPRSFRLATPSAVVNPDPEAIIGIVNDPKCDVRVTTLANWSAASIDTISRISESMGLTPRPYVAAYRRTGAAASLAFSVSERPAIRVIRDSQSWMVGSQMQLQGEWTIEAEGPRLIRIDIPKGLTIVSCQVSPAGTVECRHDNGVIRMLVMGPPDPTGPIVIRWQAIAESSDLPILHWPGSTIAPDLTVRSSMGWKVTPLRPGAISTDAKTYPVRIERLP